MRKGESKGYYPLVNKDSNGISPFSIGNTSSKGPCSIAMLVCRSVNDDCAWYEIDETICSGHLQTCEVGCSLQNLRVWIHDGCIHSLKLTHPKGK